MPLPKLRDMEETVRRYAPRSSCLKRVTVCLLFDREQHFLSAAANTCAPEGGVCADMNRTTRKDGYARASCHGAHAEIGALAKLPKGVRPFRSVLFGHEFYCDSCEQALKTAGVRVLEVRPTEFGTGKRLPLRSG